MPDEQYGPPISTEPPRHDGPGSGRRALVPASDIPLLYFGFAHACLATALGVLVVRPDLPGGFFHYPRMVAVVHLVTLGWISASILGAFYIVGPLALRLPLRPDWRDRLGFVAFAAGVLGMVAHFWIGEYTGMVWSALPVAAAVVHVGVRAWRGLPASPAPWPVRLHVALAFANMILASAFGMLVGLNRIFGWLPWSPLSAAFAHAHLAAVGWAVMMVVGLSYRLIPMIVPAEMPTGPSLAISAVLLEIGTLGLAAALVSAPGWSPVAALVIVAGIGAFVMQVWKIVTRKLPPPVALPRPDWATWQTHIAFVWLLVAASTGVLLTLPVPPAWIVALGWLYGTTGLVGFLSQVVIGIQGRLLPLHAWYRRFEAAGLKPPARSVHTLARPGLAKAILIAWTCGVPVLAGGLVTGASLLISIGAAFLLGGVALNGVQMIAMASTEAGA